MGIYELMELSAEMQAAIVNRVSQAELQVLAIKAGMHTLREDGIAKVWQGITTVEEVLRVTR
jgi:general secretion pathway protein E